VAQSLNNLGEIYLAQNKFSEAELLFKEARAIREKNLGADHPEVAQSLNNLGELNRLQGKFREAESFYKQALAITLWKKSPGQNNLELANSFYNLARLYSSEDKYAQAEPLFKLALTVRDKSLGTYHPDVANVLEDMVGLYKKMGKNDKAKEFEERLFAVRSKSY
jgi:tetratricopeptide (TPR) repeat protein